MDTETKTGLCESCKQLREIAFTDGFDREFCEQCHAGLSAAQEATLFWMYSYLMATIPFKVGDKVSCRTAGVLYDGIGTIDEVSFEPEKYGTIVYPSFHVVIEEKAYSDAPDALWYTETCLSKLTSDGEQDKQEEVP
jgi:hypothetical protein